MVYIKLVNPSIVSINPKKTRGPWCPPPSCEFFLQVLNRIWAFHHKFSWFFFFFFRMDFSASFDTKCMHIACRATASWDISKSHVIDKLHFLFCMYNTLCFVYIQIYCFCLLFKTSKSLIIVWNSPAMHFQFISNKNFITQKTHVTNKLHFRSVVCKTIYVCIQIYCFCLLFNPLKMIWFCYNMHFPQAQVWVYLGLVFNGLKPQNAWLLFEIHLLCICTSFPIKPSLC